MVDTEVYRFRSFEEWIESNPLRYWERPVFYKIRLWRDVVLSWHVPFNQFVEPMKLQVRSRSSYECL